MHKLLGSLTVIALLAPAGSAIACSMNESASNDQTVVTASAPAQSTAPNAGTTTTTTPKTPQADTGG
jgi:hypothetical protein